MGPLFDGFGIKDSKVASRQLLLTLSTVAAITVFLRHGTVSPCGIVRVQVREAGQREGGPGGALAGVVPDGIIDSFIRTKYGDLSLDRCIALALSNATPEQSAAPAPIVSTAPASPRESQTPEYLKPVVARAQAVILECRNKRLSGEFRSFEEFAVCIKRYTISLFEQAHYNHMELIEQLMDERIDLARKIDQGWLTETQAGRAFKDAAAKIDNEERLLDTSR